METKNKSLFYALISILILVVIILGGYIFLVSQDLRVLVLDTPKPVELTRSEREGSEDPFEVTESPFETETPALEPGEPTPIPPKSSEPDALAVEIEPKDPPVEELYDCGLFPCYDSQGFLDLYSSFEHSGKLSFVQKYIYNIPEVDDYIRAKAEARGYQPRGFADEKDLVTFESLLTRPELRNAYIKMRDEMAKENIRLHFVSAYRSSVRQRSIFTGKLNASDPLEILTGKYDDKIEEILTVSSIPGYSKHHSGYAIDFGCGNNYLVYTFNETECYAWLSENNFENAKRFGFIPSYPEEGGVQGPNPEPWEYVWVGSDYIKNPTQ